MCPKKTLFVIILKAMQSELSVWQTGLESMVGSWGGGRGRSEMSHPF